MMQNDATDRLHIRILVSETSQNFIPLEHEYVCMCIIVGVGTPDLSKQIETTTFIMKLKHIAINY